MREFIKNISIYGLLPVLGKFLGFFLIPIYARVFSTNDFGVVELVTSLISFLIFACNLEMYSSIGRYFYEKNTLEERRKLISTGFILTIITTLIVSSFIFLSEDFIYEKYFESYDYKNIFRVAIIWLTLSALSTYLSIIPRYEKKVVLYVVVNFTALFIRLVSTIVFVLWLKVGIIGIVYGHICGDFTSLILNAIISKKYLGFAFKKEYVPLILKFALPLVPGLLLIGLWEPVSRNLITMFFSVSVVGLFAFANRFTSINSIFSGALRNAWQPMLFENINDLSFSTQIKKIGGLSVFVTLGIGTAITLLAPELCLILGTETYQDSDIFVGFLSLSGALSVLSQIRGFGPLVYNKTYINSIINIICFLFGVLLFYIIRDRFGLIGLGFILLTYQLASYLLLTEYTRIKSKIKFYNRWEIGFLFFIVLAEILVVIDASLGVRLLTFTVFGGFLIYVFRELGGISFIKKVIFKR